ncbi:hydrolase [Sinosporangium siamense]|uniref:Hydrolase n=1 Tax=Sinosporangium siamense TaxID=1367973 RepID=A0A919V4K4_9ACTN|nr:hydrolase [Sinosporangium siamense]
MALFSRNIGTPGQVAELTAALRAENPGLLVGIDEESGEVTRLEVAHGSTRPGSFALGVVDDTSLTEEIARELGHDLAEIGVNFDFAPSVDVNSNPDNPVIGLRSFGADPALVARHARAFIRGMQSAGVAACAKHFPGHGDTAVDSHHALPLVTAGLDELSEIALLPFREAIEEGVRSIMTAHLLVPAYDGDRAATLSPRVLTGLLRDELGYDGLIITDGIEMQAVAGPHGLGRASALAIAAGADLVCVGGEHADEASASGIRDAIVSAVMEGWLPEERLVEAARRVRELAAWTSANARARTAPASEVGLVAARRAVRVTRRTGEAVLPLTAPPQVVELAPLMNLAIDKHTPWGIGEPLSKLLPGTSVTRFTASEATGAAIESVLAAAADRPLVVAARDAHRHAWQTDALNHLLSARPDTIVVEMGLPGRSDLGAVHIATHGAARVCGQAAAEIIVGIGEGSA